MGHARRAGHRGESRVPAGVALSPRAGRATRPRNRHHPIREVLPYGRETLDSIDQHFGATNLPNSQMGKFSGDQLVESEGLFPDARRSAEVGADPREGRGQVGVRLHGQARPEAEGRVRGMRRADAFANYTLFYSH